MITASIYNHSHAVWTVSSSYTVKRCERKRYENKPAGFLQLQLFLAVNIS